MQDLLGNQIKLAIQGSNSSMWFLDHEVPREHFLYGYVTVPAGLTHVCTDGGVWFHSRSSHGTACEARGFADEFGRVGAVPEVC